MHGGDGDDSLFGGWGADACSAGRGNDELHALAADGDADLLHCGPGATRPGPALGAADHAGRRLRDVYVVDVLTPEQEADENADADTEADG